MGQAKRKLLALSTKAKRFIYLIKLINPKYEDWKTLQALKNRNLITINSQQRDDHYRIYLLSRYVKVEFSSEVKKKLMIKGEIKC